MSDIKTRPCGFCIECIKIGDWKEAEFIFKGNGLCPEHFTEKLDAKKKQGGIK